MARELTGKLKPAAEEAVASFERVKFPLNAGTHKNILTYYLPYYLGSNKKIKE